MGRVVGWAEAVEESARWRAQGRVVVFTNGHFDLLHYGHVRYLQEARALGDVLIVGINDDASTRALKGPGRPLFPAEERAAVVAALACVDRVVIFPGLTAEDLVGALRPQVYVKGGDWSPSEGGARPEGPPEARVVRRYGGRVVFLPYLPGHSTSDLIARIAALAATGEGHGDR
jgi:rfaE bifunctional protein nucleotidyltransferase chain/domain